MKTFIRGIMVAVSFFLATPRSLAQDPASFFPHHLGDMWEYLWCWEIGKCDTIQVYVIKDSLGENGSSYLVREAHLINPREPPTQVFADTEYYEIDSVNRVFWTRFPSSPSPWVWSLKYDLQAKEGEIWIVDDFDGWYDIARVEEVYEGFRFGVPVTYKMINYYSTGDTSDTTQWFHLWSEDLASGLGLAWLGGGEAMIEVYLIGAVIDGILYGDTTLATRTDRPLAGIIPEEVQLLQNYPNPFNPWTVIPFVLDQRENVSLRIYDITGRLIRTLIDNKQMDTGVHQVPWNGLNTQGQPAASGIYFYELRNRDKIRSRRMLLVR